MREHCYCEIKLDEGARLPERKHPEDAGFDLYASEDAMIPAGGWKAVDTGVHTNPRPGWYIQIVPRSGLAYKSGISVLNTPGTIDSNYRNSIKVIMYNISDSDYEVHIGDRIAQMIFTPAYNVDFVEVDELEDSDRGLGGFGSTGK